MKLFDINKLLYNVNKLYEAEVFGTEEMAKKYAFFDDMHIVKVAYDSYYGPATGYVCMTDDEYVDYVKFMEE